MITRPFIASAAAMLCSVALLAQSKSNDNRITVTGCIERADQMAGNSATTTVDSLSFVLIKSQAEKPTGTSGTAAATPDRTAMDRMYRLDGKTEDLNPHVGQKVEIAGTVAETPTAPAGATSSTNAPRLKVETVRVVDATCPR